MNKKTNNQVEIGLASLGLIESLENLKLPNPGLKQFYEDLEDRIIWIDDEITEDKYNSISKKIFGE